MLPFGGILMPAILREIGALLCVPVLLFIAWREWVRSVRALLPAWRNGIALTGLLIISLTWVVAVLIDAPELLHTSASLSTDVKWVIYLLVHPVGTAALIFAFALKREARLGAVVASMLLLTCWPGGYN